MVGRVEGRAESLRAVYEKIKGAKPVPLEYLKESFLNGSPGFTNLDSCTSLKATSRGGLLGFSADMSVMKNMLSSAVQDASSRSVLITCPYSLGWQVCCNPVAAGTTKSSQAHFLE